MFDDARCFADSGATGPLGWCPEGICGVGGPVLQIGRPFNAEALTTRTHRAVQVGPAVTYWKDITVRMCQGSPLPIWGRKHTADLAEIEQSRPVEMTVAHGIGVQLRVVPASGADGIDEVVMVLKPVAEDEQVPAFSGAYQAVVVGNAAHGWFPESRHDVVKAKRGAGIDGTMESGLPSGKTFSRQCGSGSDHGGIPIRVGKPGNTVVPGRIL